VRARRASESTEDFLESHCQVRVRFQEVDALRVTWHGHYLTYFEEGRNAFGRKFGFGYHEILAAGFAAPLVHLELDFLLPSRFDELLNVRTRLHFEPGARLHYSYRITGEDGPVRVTGHTIQVFTDLQGTLMYCRPRFYEEFLEEWKASTQRV
jgi:acyl-CoA thioester hydrolase